MRKKYIRLSIVFLMIIIIGIIGLIINKHDMYYKTYTGKSLHWKVSTHMVKEGTTTITILPMKEFEYPNKLRIDIQELDNSMHTEKIRIKPINSYAFKYPTFESFNRNVDKIMFNIYFIDGTYEEVELQLED